MSYTTILLLGLIPFIICDLWYAYNYNSCVQQPIKNTNLTFALDMWLKVSGFTSISILLFPILHMIIKPIAPILLFLYAIYLLVWLLFRFIWLIVGAVIFWGYLAPNNYCDGGLATYMWINLIVGFIHLLGLLWFQREISNQVQPSRNKHRI